MANSTERCVGLMIATATHYLVAASRNPSGRIESRGPKRAPVAVVVPPPALEPLWRADAG